MFIRNGQALGSVHHATASKAARPTPRRGRPPKTVTPQLSPTSPVDEATVGVSESTEEKEHDDGDDLHH